ncbi:MAG: BamA/TamA family outer membrane protein [Bacteroidales bacterium]|nr:BamA/TamA family outer membrane protein [Bacteroidales bacterium]
MLKKRLLLAFVAVMSICSPAFAQDAASGDIVKKGISLGPLPVVAFDQDKGFQYGALLNIYNFGDGTTYPVPKSQWYLEASFFTKGSKLFVVNFDSRTLIPGVRTCLSATYTDDKALDFYGFNGYDTYIDHSILSSTSSYYRMSRAVPYIKADFTGNITRNLYWKAGYHFKYFKISEFIPEDGPHFSLFSLYKSDGVGGVVIPGDEADGGISSSVRAGLMYDSRNFEAAPSRGIWAEANLEYAPSWLGTSKEYLKYYVAFRNYLPIWGDKLVFAYRLNAQGFLKDPAFYMLPFETILGYGYDRDGFGGYRTVRGIMRNRIQGRSVCYYNSELRWRFVDFHLFNQNIGLAVSGFCDGGRVLVPYGGVKFTEENFHIAAGGGFRFIMNRNFIVAVEYGVPFKEQDRLPGKAGSLYINTGFLF